MQEVFVGICLRSLSEKSSMVYNNAPTCLQNPLAPALQVH